MKVRIEFPEDIAKDKVQEAKEWEEAYEESKKTSGKLQPLAWEAEDFNVQERIKKVGDNLIIETKHTKVELTKEEVRRIIELFG